MATYKEVFNKNFRDQLPQLIQNFRFSFQQSDKVTFRVYPVILKNLSWINYQKLMKEGVGYSTYLLEHERLHYYISILNARRLKVYANEHPPKNRDEMMNLMVDYANKNQGDQDAYDEATKHAFLKDKQEEWSKKIMAEYEATDSIKLDLPK
jgi:hypothetical protein